jgi:hypothetical protein
MPPTPHDQAERALAEALRARARLLEPQIAAAFQGVPGAFAVFAMLRMTKAFEQTRQQDRARALKAAAAPELAELLRCLARPSWKSIVELEKGCGRLYGLIDPFYDGPSGMVDRIAEALGVELDPPPTLEDFLKKGGSR